jgi:hypothetical protein
MAIFEFIIATLILLFFRRSIINNFFAVFIYVLGFYQFTEFMLCSTSYPVLWAKLGFITYTFLPAIGLHSVIAFTKKKYNLFWIYILPVLFALFALFKPDFILQSECHSCLVIVRSYFFNPQNIVSSIIYFLLYYFGFIALTFFVIIKNYKRQKSKIVKKIAILMLIAIVISLLPAVILLMIFPSLGILFPSMYCEFAVLFSIIAIIVAVLDKKESRAKK